MSESPQKRSVDDVAAPEVAEDSKRSKAEDKDAQAVQESVLGGAEAGPSDEKDINEDEIDEDELAALDEANIISGPRTRGKKIDFRKASEEAGGEEEDDEEDADVTANTTMPKSDEESEEEDEEDVDGTADTSDVNQD